ncbi:1-acyl-sn-glycerol-3-phosphate acyltransferase [Patescibacteria group bacterium]|nr:1-acyl-sn-glycerol-3-phosphate acyltransferase [Patescibacteria group bacterium]MBU4082745.1 1-acyl-sn-glycerol-3-phosphate acyltransferase [Patescibacteria group bacterium]MBU4141903.1 1-acyl-sn-glycerol-3-phosphate acyltransferase [Patescibacteria group bacterium]
MPNFIIIIFQILSCLVFSVITRVFYKTKVILPKNINQLKKGSLLIANHRSPLDPFIITARIPLLKCISIMPIRFPVCHEFMNMPFVSLLLKLLGCYDVGQTKRENMLALFRMRQLLQKKQTVFLFPEGKVCKKGGVEEFKKGVEFLVNESKNVVFVRIEFSNKIKFPVFVSECNLKFSPVKSFDDKIESGDLRTFLERL